MSRPQRYVKPHANAITRRRLQAKARHARQPRQAQRALAALHHARPALGWPDHLGTAIAGRLRAQTPWLGHICGRLCPTLCGGSQAEEGTRTRGWDQPLPSRILSALPQRSWRKRWRPLGPEGRSALWRHGAARRDATRRRGPWPGGVDDAGCRTDGPTLAWGGHGARGPGPRVGQGIAGVLWLVVMGAGPRVVPVDWAVRRPAPTGPGARWRPKREWPPVRRAQPLAAWARRGWPRPAPRAAAASWWSEAQLRSHVSAALQGTWLGQGPATSPLRRHEGRQVHGGEVVHGDDGPWRPRRDAPGSECHLGRRHPAPRGQGRCGSLRPRLLGSSAAGHALAPGLGASAPDCPGLAHSPASVGHRGVPSPQRRGL
jgi:hypothetical protein